MSDEDMRAKPMPASSLFGDDGADATSPINSGRSPTEKRAPRTRGAVETGDAERVEPAVSGADVELGQVPKRKGPHGARKAKQARMRPASEEDRTVRAIEVSARALVFSPTLGFDAAEFASSNVEGVEGAADLLRRGTPPSERPQVLQMADGRFGAISGLETAAAAINLSAKYPDLRIGALLVHTVDEAKVVVEQLATARGRSGWEQYQALRPIFGEGSVRDKLSRLDLEIDRWESKVSKVLKVGRLDQAILSRVILLTIPVTEAGQVVEAWKDEQRRSAMEDVLADVQLNSNERVPARELFKTLLAASMPKVLLPDWETAESGERTLVTAEGNVLATVTLNGSGWVASGVAMSAVQWRALGRGMPRAGK